MTSGVGQWASGKPGRRPAWMVRLTDEDDIAATGVPTGPPHRLAAVTAGRADERGAFLRVLADHPRVELTVCPGCMGGSRAATLAFVREVFRGEYDAVLVERYVQLRALLACLAARVSGTAIFLRVVPGAAWPHSRFLSWLQRLARRPFLRRTDGVLASAARPGWPREHDGVPAERVFRTAGDGDAGVAGVVEALDCVGRRRVAWRHEEPRWVVEQDERLRWPAMGESEGRA